MTQRYFIGVDDTDYGDSIGTGALARELHILVRRHLGLASLGITRHQLLVHPDIPYTSHNSSACIGLEGNTSVEELARLGEAFIAHLFHPGADPALCIAPADRFSPECIEFGRRAQEEVVQKGEAVALADGCGIFLKELGGTGLGAIGALCACSLRASGNDGRFISLPGIREIAAEATVGTILSTTEIDIVVDEDDNPVPESGVVAAAGGVRPNLRNGVIVLPVLTDGSGYRAAKRNKWEDR